MNCIDFNSRYDRSDNSRYRKASTEKSKILQTKPLDSTEDTYDLQILITIFYE